MKTLVTGITGFVGKNLQTYLGKENVIGVSRDSGGGNITYEEYAANLDNVDAVIHLAGKAHDLKKTADDSAYFEVNRDLTIRLFDQFLKSTCPVFIYMSSVKAAADIVEGDFLTEEVEPKPATPYGKSKLEAEQYLLSKDLPQDKKVYILRPCMIHGPDNKGNLNLLYQFVAKGVPYPLASFANKRSFLSVENLCFVIQKLIQKRPNSGVFQVADDEPLSTNDLIRIIGESMGKKVKLWRFSKRFIKSMARVGDVLHLPLNSERLQKLTENYIVSNNKLIETLDIILPLSSREGLSKTIKSFSK